MLINPLFAEDLNLPTLLHLGLDEILIWQKHWLGLGCLTALLFSDCLVEHKVMVQCSLEICFQSSMAEYCAVLLIQCWMGVFRVCKWNNRNKNLGNAEWKLGQCKLPASVFSLLFAVLWIYEKLKGLLFILAWKKILKLLFLSQAFFFFPSILLSQKQRTKKTVCLKTDEKSQCVFMRKWSWVNKIPQISPVLRDGDRKVGLINSPRSCYTWERGTLTIVRKLKSPVFFINCRFTGATLKTLSWLTMVQD